MKLESTSLRSLGSALFLAAEVFLFLVLTYWVRANVLLTTPLLKTLMNSEEPDATRIEYDAAWSPWPGRVEVRGLRIRERDGNAEWMFEMERTRFSYSMAETFWRKFHARGVRGEGLLFRARTLLRPGEATPARTRSLPPIAGFPDPPLLPPHEKPTLRTGKEWTVHVERLRVERLGEIWIDAYRFAGRGMVAGGFRLEPNLEAHVFPSSLSVARGTLQRNKQAVAARIHGRISCEIPPWKTEDYPGNAVFRLVIGQARIEGEFDGLDSLENAFGRLGSARLAGGAGPFSLAVVLDRGRGGAEMEINSRRATLLYRDARLTGTALIRVNTKIDVHRGSAELSGSNVEVTNFAASDATDRTRAWWGRITVVSGRYDPGTPLTAGIQARVRDARPLFALLKADFPRWVRDLLALEGLEVRTRARFEGTVFEVRGLEASAGKFQVRGRYRAGAGSERGLFLIERDPFAVGVALRDGDTDLKLFGARRWYAKASVEGPGD